MHAEMMEGGSRELSRIAIDDLRAWTHNPRRTLDLKVLEELAASIRRKGLLQPLTVRPSADEPDAFEVICGERRWRAARIAGLDAIACVVREDLEDDDEALECNITENIQRADVHPLEEGDGLQLLRDRGRSVEDIAAELGRRTTYVYQRLALVGLCPLAREAFMRGRLTLAAAVMLGRLRDPKVQADVFDRVLPSADEDDDARDPVDVRHLRWAVQEHSLRLADAPWPLDAEIAPRPCSTCPTRTAAQAVLFGEVDEDDRCTEPKCFAAKKTAHTEQRIKAAKRAGNKVLSASDAKKLYPNTWTANSAYEVEDAGYYDLDHRATPSTATWRKVLGDRSIATVIATDPHTGDVHELVRVEAVEATLRVDPRKGDPGSETESSSSKGKSSKKSAAKKTREQLVEEAKNKAVGTIFDELAARIGTELTIHDALRFLARSMLIFGLGDDVRIARRVGLTVAGYGPDNAKKIITAIAKASPEQLLAMCFEVTLLEDFPLRTDKKDPSVAQLVLEHAGVDWLAIEQEEIESATATPGTCRRCGCTHDDGDLDDGSLWTDERKTLCTSCAHDAEAGKAKASKKKTPAKTPAKASKKTGVKAR